MIGSLITRALLMIFGYVYPAYECYKTVEKNKPDIEHLRFWCQYWILVAILTFCERIGDAVISWLPMYNEAKLALVIYLWYPRTKGTTYVYDSFFRPYVAKHENDIDRNLMELRTRAGDIAVMYWQRAASYGKMRTFDILQYVAAQSAPRPRNVQQQQPPSDRAATSQPPPPATTNHQQTFLPQAALPQQRPEPCVPASSSSSSSSNHQAAVHVEAREAVTIAAAAASDSKKESQPSSSEPIPSEADSGKGLSQAGDEPAGAQKESNSIIDSLRVTRARLRKTRSISNHQ